MIPNVELIAATVRIMLEKKGYLVYPTYPPETKSAHMFGAKKEAMYVRVICLTQRITSNEYDKECYLFYRNKITRAGEAPTFSSVEFGTFDKSTGSTVFSQLFKLHKEDSDGKPISDEDYVGAIVEKIIANTEENSI